jgi:hypothetical protein
MPTPRPDSGMEVGSLKDHTLPKYQSANRFNLKRLHSSVDVEPTARSQQLGDRRARGDLCFLHLLGCNVALRPLQHLGVPSRGMKQNADFVGQHGKVVC